MPTLSSLVEETKRHLLSYQREPRNKLAANYSAGGTTLAFTYDLGAIKAGVYVQLDLELFYVWSVDDNAKTAVVDGAQLGSVAANHDSGDIAVVNPRFPDFAIAKALNDEITSLSSPANGLYAVRYVDLTSNPARTGYNLDGVTSIIDVLEVRQRDVNTSYKSWPRVTSFTFDRSVSSTDFPSGFALFLPNGSAASQPLRVQYKAGFSTLTNLTDDVSTTGLPASAYDIPPIGAAWRLVAPREIKRNFTESQGDTRRADEVSPGAVAASSRNLAILRQQRIMEEATALAQLYPPREAMSYGTPGRVW